MNFAAHSVHVLDQAVERARIAHNRRGKGEAVSFRHHGHAVAADLSAQEDLVALFDLRGRDHPLSGQDPDAGSVDKDPIFLAFVHDLGVAGNDLDACLYTNPLIVLNDLSLTSGSLIANNLSVTIGGNYTIAAGTTYTPGTNTTIFNGSSAQSFTVDLAGALSLNKLTIDKPAGIALNFAGSQPVINVSSDFRLVLGTLNDNGNSLNIGGNVYNSGVHAGNGKVVLNGTALQSIDGNGIFGNIELNNTNVAAAPVSLAANMTINGQLTFSQNNLFNINTYNLKLNSGASIVNGGPLRYIKTAGNSGDGGLTKTYSSPVTFDFPVGVVNYTPASIGLSVAPTVYGSITVLPVNYEHPNVTNTGRSLTYFWRVKSSGFTLGAATVTHGYTYSAANVVAGGTVSEVEYKAARFNIITSTWTKGTVNDVDEAGKIIGEPGSGSFLENIGFIDGDYTAGDDNPTDPFGIPTVFYSRINGAAAGNGLWSDVNTWSITSHTGGVAGTIPGAGDIVIIGARDSVYLATDNSVPKNTPNVGPRSCASLKIEKGSALDIGYNPASSFGMVLNHPSGNGNFRVTTSDTDGSVYAFPSGDFTDFNVNKGTTEFYTTNPAIGPIFMLPPNVTSYGTVILSPLGGSNLALPNVTTGNLTIYGDLICRGQNTDSWLAMTWFSSYGAINAKTVDVRGSLLVQGGSLVFLATGPTAQNFIVAGDVIVSPGAGIDIAPWGGVNSSNCSMSIGGSLINNSNNNLPPSPPWIGGSVRLFYDVNNRCNLTFFGNSNASITNTGLTPATGSTPVTILANITVNKGTSQSTLLTLDIGGTLTTLTDNWLTLQNGTLRFMRNNPGSDFAISTTTPFSIPATSGFLVNLPSNSGNRNILIGNAANTTGDLLLSGKLTLINGNVYVGPTASPASANDIEYSSSGASSIDIQGGNLVINGQVRRNPSNAGGVLQYSQSGGSVVINGQGANLTNAKLEVLNSGSDFTMSNGTLTIVRGNGATVTPSSPFGDLYLRPQTGTVTGGTIVFSQGLLTTQNYFLDATIPLKNLAITGAAGQTATVRLLTSPLVLSGDMTINANSILNSNNINITFNGNLINTPGVGGYVFGTNLTTFSAPSGSSYGGVQTITGATNFYDLSVSPGVSLTLGSASTINHNLVIQYR